MDLDIFSFVYLNTWNISEMYSKKKKISKGEKNEEIIFLNCYLKKKALRIKNEELIRNAI